MTRSLQATFAVAITGFLGIAGCQCCSKCCHRDETAAANYPGSGPGLLPAHPLTPENSSAPQWIEAPQPPVPTVPPGSVGAPPADPRPYATPAQPPGFGNPPADPRSFNGPAQPRGSAGAPKDTRSFDASGQPPAVPAWSPPANSGVRLSSPEIVASEPAAPKSPPVQPRVTEDRAGAAPLPVGIPQFAAVNDKVASGLRPLIDGGLDWLKAHGYKTILHVRAPGADDVSDRKQVEKLGMTYLALEVSPDKLTQATVDQFNRVVGESANYPLFVYDKDGVLAGGLWYLYFRTAELMGDEAARTRAGRLGLKEDAEGSSHEMWLAIQKLLSKGGVKP